MCASGAPAVQSLAGLLSRWPVPAAFACDSISVGAAGICFSAAIDGDLMGTGALQISELHAFWWISSRNASNRPPIAVVMSKKSFGAGCCMLT